MNGIQLSMKDILNYLGYNYTVLPWQVWIGIENGSGINHAVWAYSPALRLLS